MKGLILSLGIMFFSKMCFSQEYHFSIRNDEFTFLENPILVSDPFDIWFGDNWPIQLPFEFSFFERTFTGEITLWSGSIYFDDENFIDGFGALLMDRNFISDTDSIDLSPVYYAVVGEAGQRILKVEYKEAGFFDGTENDMISFQIWLYEGSNIIEIHIGPSSIDPFVYKGLGYVGPYIGIRSEEIGKYIYVDGDPINPTLYTSDDLFSGLNGTPQQGTVYVFKPFVSAIDNEWYTDREEYAIYPNPVANIFTISMSPGEVIDGFNIINSFGTVIHGCKKIIERGIDVSYLENGIYYCIFTLNNEVHARKFVVKK